MIGVDSIGRRSAINIIGIIEGLETKEKNWTEFLAETRTDCDAQETIIAAPFAKQKELEQKTARFNEVMAILNPKEEQIMGEDDTVQEQSRSFLEDDEPKGEREWSAFNRSLSNKTASLHKGESKK